MRNWHVINKIKRCYAKLPVHWLLAALVVIHGYLLLQATLPAVYRLLSSPSTNWLKDQNIHEILDSTLIAVLFSLVLGAGLLINAVGLAMRARTAWVMSLLLLLSNLAYDLLYAGSIISLASVNSYLLLLLLLLVLYGRRFNQASVISGTLFALLGVSLLLMYATFGTLYLGKEYSPPITDMSDAIYFSIVAMSTVGFGDIVPNSADSRLFTISIIVLGITVFATSVSAVIGPILQGRIKHLVSAKDSKYMKKNHIIVAGVTPLAQSVYTVLRKADHDVVVIVPPDSGQDYPADADIIIGDATDSAVLIQANAAHAAYILALHDDDSENAFIVLAAHEVAGTDTGTVALVNSSIHLNKVKQVKPDVILSLQSLGAEILGRLVTGEPITDELISQLLLPLDQHAIPSARSSI